MTQEMSSYSRDDFQVAEEGNDIQIKIKSNRPWNSLFSHLLNSIESN